MSVPLAVFHSNSVKLNTWEGALTDLPMGIPRWGSGAFLILRSFPLRKLRMKEVQHISSSSEPQRHGPPHVKWKEQQQQQKAGRQKLSQKSNQISTLEKCLFKSHWKSQEGKNDQSKNQSTKETKSYRFLPYPCLSKDRWCKVPPWGHSHAQLRLPAEFLGEKKLKSPHFTLSMSIRWWFYTSSQRTSL